MLSSQAASTSSFFYHVSTPASSIPEKLLREFILSPDGKDKKGLDHICYGDLNGGGHMILNEINLERKRAELSKKHSEKSSADYEKLKEKLLTAYDDGKLKDNLTSALQKAKEKGEKKIKDAVENEISQLEKRINKIIHEEKTSHNFFPSEWGPLKIGEIISGIIKDENSIITEVPTLPAATEKKEIGGSKTRYKRTHGLSWEVKGKYNEIVITVIIAEDKESKQMKLISAYPTSKIENQQNLLPMFSTFK